MGTFVRPGRELYPHQWNWDSAFVALGLAHVDPERGRAEVRSLLKGQWRDGMVPHIVFHAPAPDYYPGPELWDSAACEGAPRVPTSGLTQPPVLATAVRVLHEASPDPSFVEEVVPALERWHAWLHRERGSDGGLVAIVHPWEGADNSPRFDRALARLQVDEAIDIERTDRREIDASERPTDSDYARYLYLVRRLQEQGYRPQTLGDTPFVFVDLTFNSILARRRRTWPGSGASSVATEPGRALRRRASARRWRTAGTIAAPSTSRTTATPTRRTRPSMRCFRSTQRSRDGCRHVVSSRRRSGRRPLRSLIRGAVGGDDGLEVELGVRSS